MKIDTIDKRYVDARNSPLFITKFTNLELLEHTHNDVITSSYDDILAALTVNQMLFENSSQGWELYQPDRLIEVQLDSAKLYIFHTTLSRISITSEEGVFQLDVGDSPGMIILTEQPMDGEGVMLPGTHGFIKIENDDNYNMNLKLGGITIGLEHN